jgi:hypothetical protein
MKTYSDKFFGLEDPYKVAKEKGVYETLEVESTLTTEVIC